MKKTLLICFVLLCLVLAGCGGQSAGDGKAQTETETAAPAIPDLNKTVVKEENAPKIFWKADIAYHLENCPTLKEGVETKSQEIPWAVAKEIGLRQCPVCNPPRYEGYVEAK